MPTPTPATRPTTPATYRIVRHREARGTWYEVEGLNANGARWSVAVCDDRHEARETVRNLEAYEARQAAAAVTAADLEALAAVFERDRAAAEASDALAAAQASARSLQLYRRAVAARLPGDAWARLRDRSASLVADRAAIAAAIRDARAMLRKNPA